MILILAMIVALALHVLLGWQWSLVGGLAAGVGAERVGWIQGAVAVATSWLILVGYNFAVSPDEMARFLDITSRLFGNMPTWLLVVSTVLLGTLLGLLGGVIGAQLRALFFLFRGRATGGGNHDAPAPEAGPPSQV